MLFANIDRTKIYRRFPQNREISREVMLSTNMAQRKWDIHFINLILFIFYVTCRTVNSKEISYKVESPSIYDSVILADDTARYRRQADNTTPAPTGITNITTEESVKPTTQQQETTSTAVPAEKTTKTNQGGGSAATTTERPKTSLPTIPFTTSYPLKLIEDNHVYYNSVVIQSEQEMFWHELEDVLNHEALSDGHRVAVVVKLSFRFPFYGHSISNITIATGGFLYMSPFLHQWLTATQYIAPLMANFDTSLGNFSDICYKDYGNKFVIEWKNVHLKDQNSSKPFQFQTILHWNGSITFVYKSLPLQPQIIFTTNHPVKIGVSDAFYIDSTVFGYKRRTIYEYHKLSLNFSTIRTGTVVLLHPLVTCNIASDCNRCIKQNIGFECEWCPEISRCSDGVDWHRQEWLDNGCVDLEGNDGQCPTNIPVGVIVAIVLLLLAVIGGISGWCIYAYKNPQSSSGQWLISHRPSQMKETVAKMKFWKKSTPSGENYRLETEA